MKKATRGCTLLEVVVASSFLAVASLGLGGAMVSGATLENQASRTLSEVATAENLMEQIRHQSWTKFSGVINDYSGKTTASNSATGYVTDDQRTVLVCVALGVRGEKHLARHAPHRFQHTRVSNAA